MGYCLEALVTATSAAETQPLPSVPLRQSLSLIPLPRDVHKQSDDAVLHMTDMFFYLSSKIQDLAVRISYHAPVAYLEAELFGGTGSQAAVVWHQGAVVLGPMIYDNEPGGRSSYQVGEIQTWPFNSALRFLGVQASEDVDEFDTVDLGRHRHTEGWTPTIPASTQDAMGSESSRDDDLGSGDTKREGEASAYRPELT
jgi:hypothetical protein